MSRLKNPGLWIGVASACLVLGVAIVDLQRPSPGPLAKVHAREEMSCAQCHGGWFGTMTESCLKCHEAIGDQIDAGTGLHGKVSDAKSCARCHSDHHGEDFVIVNRQSFLAASIPDPDAFDHTFVGFEMSGKHLEQDCAKCHKHAHDAVLPKGETRFIGLTQDCATCHEDAHEGRMALSCAQCHGQQAFDQLHSQDHEKFLPLAGGHADVSCRACHTDKRDDPYSLEALGRGGNVAARTCAACHETPHRAASMNKPDSCATCHAPETARFAAATITPDQHAAAGFKLDAPHDTVECEACHKKTEGDQEAAYPGRKQDECASCHNDPHDGQFKGQTCLACHDRQHFAPHAFTPTMHAKAGFELTGKHEEADCHACHKLPAVKKGALPVARVFSGTPDSCDRCHDNAHNGFFESVSCSLCHTTHEFRKAKPFDHTLAGFAVDGAHAQANCEVCHKRTPPAPPHGRTFGRVPSFLGCASCHSDPHEGSFKADCGTCHVSSSFRAFPKPFDHKRWTGFALTGAHDATDCASCHKPMRKPDRVGRTWGRAKGKRCADCHTDPHAGQFRKSCDACHKSADTFTAQQFKHNRDARFKLDKTHSKVSCDACHKPFRRVVRYRPLGMECADCHRAQRDPLRRKR